MNAEKKLTTTKHCATAHENASHRHQPKGHNAHQQHPGITLKNPLPFCTHSLLHLLQKSTYHVIQIHQTHAWNCHDHTYPSCQPDQKERPRKRTTDMFERLKTDESLHTLNTHEPMLSPAPSRHQIHNTKSHSTQPAFEQHHNQPRHAQEELDRQSHYRLRGSTDVGGYEKTILKAQLESKPQLVEVVRVFGLCPWGVR